MTKTDVEKLIEYLQGNVPKFVFDEHFHDGDKTVEKGTKIYCQVSQLFEMIRNYPVESDKTCGPNYESMYNLCAADLAQAQQQIEAMKIHMQKLAVEHAHYTGAVAAMETMFGRKFEINECGGNV